MGDGVGIGVGEEFAVGVMFDPCVEVPLGLVPVLGFPQTQSDQAYHMCKIQLAPLLFLRL